MPKHTVYTVITPLPAHITRQNVISFLHEHTTMIDLNPLVESRRMMDRPPAKASPEEYAHATWYELVDKVPFIPGLYSGKVVYHVCFHNLPAGLQTHCYAPLGLDIKERWAIGGFEPGEIRTPQELGLGIPNDGCLYLREDVDMRVSSLLTSFVRKNLDSAHKTLVDRLVAKAEKEELARYNDQLMGTSTGTSVAEAERSSITSGSISRERQLMQSPTSDAWPLPNDTSSLHGRPLSSPRAVASSKHVPGQLQQGYFSAPSSSPLPLSPSRDRPSPPVPSKSSSRVISIAATTPHGVDRGSIESPRLPLMPDLTRSNSETSLRIRRHRAQSTGSNTPTIKAEALSTSRSPTPTALPAMETSQKVFANSSAARSAASMSPPSTAASITSTITSSTSTLPTPLSMHEDHSSDSSPTLGNLSGPFSKQRSTTTSAFHPLSNPFPPHVHVPIQPQNHFADELQDKPAPWDPPHAPPTSVTTKKYDGQPQNTWVRAKDIGVAVGGIETGGMATVWEDKERERDRLSGAPAPQVLKGKNSFGRLPLRESA